jgi:opacity protein-like surface antigen
MRASALVAVCLAAAASACTAACSDSPLPGAMLGTYKVTGQSVTNACGLNAPDPWSFEVQLSLQGSTLYWSWMDGSPILSGNFDTQGHATLTRTGTLNPDSTDAGLGPCTLERSDTVDVVLASGNSSFGGTIGYAYKPVSGATCSDQLGGAGGMFKSLPCAMSYRVDGARQ